MLFPALSALPQFRHRFTLRHPAIDVNAERDEVICRLADWHGNHAEGMGFRRDQVRTSEQVHGNRVAVVSPSSTPSDLLGCDGMISRSGCILLGIYVADCCAVYLADPKKGAFGVLHSGKKGTEGRITPIAIRLMEEKFGCRPSDITVQLSPCIRPPAYETDFAADIRAQSLESGILPENLHDTGICTSSDLATFYSYRMEKGKTGRMMALLGRHE